MTDELESQVEQVLTPVIAGMEAEIIELNIYHCGGDLTIDVMIDKLKGGITMDECAQINRILREGLDRSTLPDGNYVIQVSSPGMDRPLKSHRDFIKIIGREVRFHLKENISGKKEYTGKVLEVLDDAVQIEEKKRNILIPLVKIQKAVQVID